MLLNQWMLNNFESIFFRQNLLRLYNNNKFKKKFINLLKLTFISDHFVAHVRSFNIVNGSYHFIRF